MRHGVKKIKFSQGKDANKMLVRKLATNFLKYGTLKTTITKVKALKSVIDRIVEKSKNNTEANKNYLLSKLNDNKLVLKLFNEIGAALKDKKGGYVRIVKLGKRKSDGSEMGRMEWVYPVIQNEKK